MTEERLPCKNHCNEKSVSDYSASVWRHTGRSSPACASDCLVISARIADRLRESGADLTDTGMIDNPIKARAAAELFCREQVDLIFLYISTYALSSTVLPIVQSAQVPFVLLNLQPVAQLDYEAFNRLGDRGRMTGLWLEHCQSCSAPEIACVLNRAEIPCHMVTGHLQDGEAWREISAVG